jgi:hypothetical protein
LLHAVDISKALRDVSITAIAIRNFDDCAGMPSSGA